MNRITDAPKKKIPLVTLVFILPIAMLIGTWLYTSDHFRGDSGRSVTIQESSTTGPTPTLSKIKVASVQYPMEENQTFESLTAKVKSYVLEAKKKGSDLVVLPELLVLDLIQTSSETKYSKQANQLATEVTPRYFAFAKALAREIGIHILAGSSPQLRGDRIYNTALLALADGRSFEQDKIFLTPDERNWKWSGGDTLKLIQAPWGLTVILICYDTEFPQLSHVLARHQPELLLVPSMTGDRSGLHRVKWTAQARAIEHYAYVAISGTVKASPEAFYGQASLITPQEPGFSTKTIEGLENKATVVYGEFDFGFLRTQREKAQIWPARDQEKLQPRKVRIEL